MKGGTLGIFDSFLFEKCYLAFFEKLNSVLKRHARFLKVTVQIGYPIFYNKICLY